ncbi:MAG: PAS domain S-box protein [Candidatus Omnitrophota bacterium]
MEDSSFLQAQLISILENLTDLVAICNSEKKVIFINKAGRAMLGIGHKEDISDFPIFDVYPSRDCRFLIDEALSLAVKNGVWSGETCLKNRLGRQLSVSQVIIAHKKADGTLDCLSIIMRDITGCKQAESELQQAHDRIAVSNKEWEKTFNSMADGVALLSPDWEILNINEPFCAILGRQRGDLIGKKCFDAVHGRDAPLPGCPCRKVKETKKKVEIELFEEKLKLWLSVSVSPALGPDGNISYMVHTVRDITERKLMEGRLREGEQELRTVMNSMPVPQFVIGADHRVICWNAALEQVSGIKAEDIVGTDQHWRAFYDEPRPCLADLLVDGLNDKISEYYRAECFKSRIVKDAYEITDYFPLSGKNGRWFDFSAVAIRDNDGKIIGAVETLEDITARKEAQDKLAASEAQYHTLVDNLNIGIYRNTIVDDGRFIQANPALAKIFGYDSAAELLNVKSVSLYSNPYDRKRYLDAIMKAGSVIGNEFLLKKRDGDPVWVSVSSRAHYDAQGVIDWIDGAVEDITDRKRTEEALRNSESKLRALFDNMSSGVAVYEAVDNGADFIIRDFNRAAERIEQIRKEDVLGRRVSEIFPAVKDFGIWDVFNRVWQTGTPEFFPVKLYKDQRISGWRENYVYRLPTNEIVAVYDDVTGRKQAEEDRDRLFNLSIDMMAVAGFDGYFKQVNPSWQRVLGWTKAEITSKPWLEFVHPDDAGRTKEAGDKLRQGQIIYAFKNRYKAQDGTYRWLSWNAFPYLEQKIIFVVGRDVTDEEKVTEALRFSESRYRMLFSAAKDGILIIDGDSGKIMDINPYLADLLQGPVEDFLNKKVWELGFLEDKLASQESFRKLQSQGYVHYENMPLRKKNGEKLDVEFVSNVYTVNGRKTIQCNIRDISERIKAQEQIRRLNAELEERVRQRTAQLESSMKELDSFSYSVSHDLQAPLRAIDGYAHIILEDHAGHLDEEGRKQFERISVNVRKMGQLINDLLSLSRLDRKEITVSDINMNNLFRRCIDELKPSYEGREIMFEIKDLGVERGDRALLHEAIVNLLANAIKFTRPRAKAVIEIGSYTKDAGRVYYVKDNGVGFNNVYVNKLFREFARLHHESEFEGTGIGLSIVQRIVSRHGGRAWAEAEIDKGATFYFTLGTSL